MVFCIDPVFGESQGKCFISGGIKMGCEVSPYERLLEVVTRAISQYIAETDPGVLFEGLLRDLLSLTDSEYGFIGEVFYTDMGDPYVRSHATTNIAWNADTRRLYQQAKKNGMVFSKPDTLYGAVLRTGRPVLANDAMSDPRSGGVPKGHPPLNTFLGLPFYGDGELLGMVGIANRAGGYTHSQIEYLQPFLATCGNLIQAYRNNLKRQHMEKELARYEQRLSCLNEKITLGGGYAFDPARQLLTLDARPVLLTRKESGLLRALVEHRGQVVGHRELESTLWKDVIVSESSLRALVLRLRNKTPGLDIQAVSGVGYLLNILPVIENITEISQTGGAFVTK